MKQSYQDLRVWKESVLLVTELYRATRSFPKEELYGLTGQMRRAAVSIPSNIAEGKGRRTNPEFKHFLMQARGSLLELETQIKISEDLELFSASKADELRTRTSNIGRMLSGLIASMGGD